MGKDRAANYTTFVERLVKQSDASEYAYARNEWVPIKYWEVNHPVKCLCGIPVKKTLIIKNIFNGEDEVVGVCCVNELITRVSGEHAERDYIRLGNNIDLIPNAAIPIFAYVMERISANEYHFLIDMSRREWEVLTPKQKKWLRVVNKKLLSVVSQQDLHNAFWPHFSIYR